jgi:hypothetical protein
MWPSGYGGGAAWRNSGDLGRGVLGKALGAAENRLGRWFWTTTTAGERHGEGQRRAPLELGLRRAWGLAGATRGWGSYRRS